MFSRRPSEPPKVATGTGGGSLAPKTSISGRGSTAGLAGMPEKKELDRQYLALLEELAIPESKRMVLMQSDDETKWKLVCSLVVMFLSLYLYLMMLFFFVFMINCDESTSIMMLIYLDGMVWHGAGANRYTYAYI